jgi:hypothetical protein
MLANAAAMGLPMVANQVMTDPTGAARLGLRGLGRLAGLSGAGMDGLEMKGIPGWVWVVAGLAGGFVAGVYAAERHGSMLPKWLPGRG